jgi:hypothetical protein
VTGTVAASPVAPPVPANAVALAQIAVGTGVAAIVAGNITDVRPGGLVVPGGRVASLVGPAAVVNIPAAWPTWTTILTVTARVVAGRRYRVYGTVFYTGSSAASAVGGIQVTPTDISMNAANSGRVQIAGLGANAGWSATGSFVYTPAASGPVTFTLAGSNSQVTTAPANGSELSVDDVGAV